MSTIELKEFLKAKIDQIDDDSFLEEFKNIIDNKVENEIILSKEQKEAIKKSQLEYLEGKFTTNDFVNEDIEKWLKE
ncbi:MAG: hypothetical protein H7250_09500 [Flavobacterium sp.]|nr:hypothetical protein [Flavobacterium sp.]